MPFTEALLIPVMCDHIQARSTFRDTLNISGLTCIILDCPNEGWCVHLDPNFHLYFQLGKHLTGMTCILDMEGAGTWMLWGPGMSCHL